MKKLFIFLALIVTIVSFAQAPQGFNYQATVRNSSGALIINQNVYFKFNIMLNSQTSVPVYTETHYVPTDDLGQVNLVVGQGTATPGAFAGINWASGTYYLGIELSTTNATSYVAMGTTQLLSVPYALYANSAGSTTGNGGGFTHYVGELYGGGIVVSVWKTAGVEHGLIASLTNLSLGIQWTTPAFQSYYIGSMAQNPRNGSYNTFNIVVQAGTGTNYAAGLCQAYTGGDFTDWYLPAKYELTQCYTSQQIINEVLGDTDGFQPSVYWSSTEGNMDYLAWAQSFNDGATFYDSKGVNYAVRAVRRF